MKSSPTTISSAADVFVNVFNEKFRGLECLSFDVGSPNTAAANGTARTPRWSLRVRAKHLHPRMQRHYDWRSEKSQTYRDVLAKFKKAGAYGSLAHGAE